MLYLLYQKQKMKLLINFSLLILIGFSSCNTKNQQNESNELRSVHEKTDSIYCGAESIDWQGDTKVYKTNTSIFLLGAEGQDSTIFRNGTNSVKLNSEYQYGFTYSIKNAKPNTKYSISVYRKSNNNKGVLVLDAGESNEINIYKKKYYSDNLTKDEWQKINLEFVTPPDYIGKELKIYCWNPDKESVWFDDFTIKIKENYEYPTYPELPQANLVISDSVLDVFKSYRVSAFKRGILVKAEKEEHEAQLELDGEKYRVEVRLKGDWLDHIQGNKWSFRVKLKDGKKWRGMNSFAFQSPHRRDFLNEWLFHKIVEDEGLITTEYDFVGFKLNGKSLGLYVYEEQFGQNMTTKKGLNDGLILKYNEDAVWQVNEKLIKSGKTDVYYPVVPASYAEPFNKKKVFKDKHKTEMFYRAQRLMFENKLSNSDITKILEIDKWAKFYALCEFGKASHGFIFHNVRYYYNDSTGLIEPISYDNYNDKGEISHYFPVDFLNNDNSRFDLNDRMGDWLLRKAMNYRVFKYKYLNILGELSSVSPIKDYLSKYSNELKKYEQMLKKEFDFYEYNYNFIKNNCDTLKEKHFSYFGMRGTDEHLSLIHFYEPIDKMNDEIPEEENIGVVAYYDKDKGVATLMNYTSKSVTLFDENGKSLGLLYGYKGIDKKRFVRKSCKLKPNWTFGLSANKRYPVKVIKFGFRVN